MLPPIEQISYELGSGGYQRPSAAAARLTSTLRAPGSTTATRLARVDLDGAHPLGRQHDAAVDGGAPRRTGPSRRRAARRGCRARLAQRSVACTCSALSARTAASGVPAVASWVQSKRYFSTASAAVTTTPSGSIPTSSATAGSMPPLSPHPAVGSSIRQSHPGSGGKVLRVLCAAVQHDDQSLQAFVGVARDVEPIAARARRAGIVRVQEQGAVGQGQFSGGRLPGWAGH